MVYNIGQDGAYGRIYKIVPETTQDFANRKTCFKVPGVNGAPIAAQGILPDLSNYQVSCGRQLACCIHSSAVVHTTRDSLQIGGSLATCHNKFSLQFSLQFSYLNIVLHKTRGIMFGSAYDAIECMWK